MAYTIYKNNEFNSIEIKFDGKPDERTRNILKANKFRWHHLKGVWYGYSEEQLIRAALEGIEAKIEEKTKEKVNKFGVKVGDLFYASWGYEQTNIDFFQVIALVGERSVRVRGVCLPVANESAVSSMSRDVSFSTTRDILPPTRSVFIKDQEKGDLKRLKSYAADGVSNPQFYLDSFADAHLYKGQELYESWYY